MEVELSMVHVVLRCVASVFIGVQTALLIENRKVVTGRCEIVFGVFPAFGIIMAANLHGKYRQQQSMA